MVSQGMQCSREPWGAAAGRAKGAVMGTPGHAVQQESPGSTVLQLSTGSSSGRDVQPPGPMSPAVVVPASVA